MRFTKGELAIFWIGTLVTIGIASTYNNADWRIARGYSAIETVTIEPLVPFFLVWLVCYGIWLTIYRRK